MAAHGPKSLKAYMVANGGHVMVWSHGHVAASKNSTKQSKQMTDDALPTVLCSVCCITVAGRQSPKLSEQRSGEVAHCLGGVDSD